MKNNMGFTLLEILVGMSLILLTISLAFLQVHQYEYVCIKQQISLFAREWHRLQQCAMAKGSPKEMIFDANNHRYRLDGQWHDLPALLKFGFLPQAKGPPSKPTTLLHSAITFPDNKVICFPDGTIQSGTVYLINDSRRCMYALTSGVSAVSFLRKYKYDGVWHSY